MSDDWQPIETAPKDGTRIIAWRVNVMSPFVVFWREHGLSAEDGEFGWLTLSGIKVHRCYGADPTHWMSLPAPPSSPKSGS